MTGSLYIAWHYIIFNRLRSAILVACITLIAFLPMALQLVLTESQLLLQSRAASTPLLLGAKGLNELTGAMGQPRIHHQGKVRPVKEIAGSQGNRRRHALPSPFRIFRHGQPLTLDKQFISALEFLGGYDRPVLKPGTFSVADLLGGQNFLERQIARLAYD